jgi:hypothetical protein
MMAKKLLFPDDVRLSLRRRYTSQHCSWLATGGSWPLSVALTTLTERDAAVDVSLVRSWVEAWASWNAGGNVAWAETCWPKLGVQRLPVRLDLTTPIEVAELIEEGTRYARAAERYAHFGAMWPALTGSSMLARHFDVLADYTPDDYERLLQVLRWLVANPNSGYFVRQLPVEGLHTKWIDKRRQALIVELLTGIRDVATGGDFHDVCGLRRAPHRVRMRLLCPKLRRATGGIADVEAPIDQLSRLALRPGRVLIVENLETGLALPDIAGCAAFMKLGHSVTVLAAVPWITGTPVVYWGDIDTHGLAILDRARSVLGDVTSVLMDERTLLSHRSLWVEEASQCTETDLEHLTAGEWEVFDKLRTHAWSVNVRLEQERIPWPAALAALMTACTQER